MSIICPTVLAREPHEYREQIERIKPFATRIQVDLMDGIFTETKSVSPIQAWWPESMLADIHMMFEDPVAHIETLVSLQPSLVIIHAEAAGDLLGMVNHLKKCGLKVGVALLKDTSPEVAHALIPLVDHVLLFSGELGKFGGEADMNVLSKVAEIKQMNSVVEIGWDGGANIGNIKRLQSGGIDVINVGGAIQKSDDPETAYKNLVSELTR